MSSVKLGVHLPMAGAGASPEGIAAVAEEAERIGLDSVWSWDRLLRPTVPIAMGGPGGPVVEAPEEFGSVYDPIEVLSYVAARTSRVTLGTSVLDTLFQGPVVLARRLATLDRLSGGRLVAGLGQGWMEQEFQAAWKSYCDLSKKSGSERLTELVAEAGLRSPFADGCMQYIAEESAKILDQLENKA